MLGTFSVDTLIEYGGMSAGCFLLIYVFTMIVMVTNFFVAILNDFLVAVANSEHLQGRDFEVMDVAPMGGALRGPPMTLN